MKVEINFQKFREAVQLVEKVAGKHMTLPVLSCILLEAGKNNLTLRSTNLDIGIETSIPAKSNEEETIAVPGHILSSFVSQVFDQNQVIRLETVSGNLHVISAKTKGVIKTVPAEDFPGIPRVTDGMKTVMPAETFVKGLKSVWYSSSVSSIKPELASVYAYKNGEHLIFAATDSFRLAEKRIRLKEGLNINDILIPFKNISDIIRVLESVSGDINVQMNKNLLSFSVGGVYLASRIIDGVFPDYKQIIPKNYTTEAVVLKQDLINSLKISNIFSDKFNQVRFTIDPKAKLFEIQTKNNDVGENKTVVDGALTGDRVEINFNYKYIADCFQSIDADSVSLQLSGLNRPMVIRPVSGDQSFMYLVMPMNR